jgi:hypothetical protein
VESFLDTGNRGMFENAGEPVALQPDFGEGQKARQAASCVPFTSYPHLIPGPGVAALAGAGGPGSEPGVDIARSA